MLNEKTIFILKPDMQNNKLIFDYFVKLLKINKLTVYKKERTIFTENMIHEMWPQYIGDVISTRMLHNYLSNKVIIIIYITGRQAIKKSLKIKYKIRSRFAVSPIQNCLHCPSNNIEYIYDRNVLKGEKQEISYSNKKCPYQDRERYSKVTEKNFLRIADRLWIELSQNKNYFDYYYFVNKNKLHFQYQLVLVENESYVYDLSNNYVASVIYNIIPNLNILSIYLCIMNTISNGESILVSSNDYETLVKYKQELEKRYLLGKVIESATRNS